jgi:hypothetical protein
VSDWLEVALMVGGAAVWLAGAAWRAVLARIQRRGRLRVAIEAAALYGALVALIG